MQDEPVFRLACRQDALDLAVFRRRMFEDMAKDEGKAVDPQELALMEAIFVQHVLARLDGEELIAWVVEVDGRLVSSAALSILPTIPAPGRLDMRWVLLHNVYTLPDYRGRGFARNLVEMAIAWCKEQGFRSLALNASAAGRPIYASLGFQPTNQMVLKF